MRLCGGLLVCGLLLALPRSGLASLLDDAILPAPILVPPAPGAALPAPPIAIAGPLSADLKAALTTALTGDPGGAVARVNGWIASHPSGKNQAPAYEVLGVALYLHGETSAAIAAFKRSIELDPARNTPLTKLGSIDLDAGHLVQARGEFERAITLDATDMLAHQRLGAVLAQQGDRAGAVRQYQLAVQAPGPDRIGAETALAQLYVQDRRFDDAIALLAPLPSDNAASLLALGSAYLGRGDVTGAVATLRAARARDPADVNATLAVGIGERAAGQTDAAVASIQHALLMKPDWAAAYYQLGLTWLAAANYAESRAAFEKARSLAPDAAEIQRGLADVLAKDGKLDAAIPIFKALAQRSDARLDDFVALAAADQAAGRPGETEQAYRDASQRFATNPAAYQRLGAILALERKYDDALAALASGRMLAPDDPDLLRDTALVQGRLGRYHDAVATVDHLVSLNPGKPEWQFLRASLLQDSGDRSGAMGAYRSILATERDNVWALNNLAAMLTAVGDTAAAMPLAQRAALLQPDNAAIQDTLGWCLLKAGQPAKAVQSLFKARDLAPQNPETLYRLAVAQQEAGDRAAARQSVAGALALDASFKDMDGARALLIELSK